MHNFDIQPRYFGAFFIEDNQTERKNKMEAKLKVKTHSESLEGIRSMDQGESKPKRVSRTSVIAKTSILAAIAYILMIFDFPLPMFPAFLKIDFSEIPALIGTFALGPAAGVSIELIKNILHLVTKTSTGGVGELGNFIVGATFVWSAGFIYKHYKTRTSAIIGCLVGTLAMTAVAYLFNIYVLIPFYANIMPIDAIIAMGSAITSKIHDIPSLVLYGVTPFNIFKGILISLITMLIYKRIKPLLKM